MTSSRVRAVQERRRSNAAGPHGSRPQRDDEPCLCGTGFTCLARVHEDEDALETSDHPLVQRVAVVLQFSHDEDLRLTRTHAGSYSVTANGWRHEIERIDRGWVIDRTRLSDGYADDYGWAATLSQARRELIADLAAAA